MCVFPTAALHPAFIPPMGATGQHGWGGDPTTPFTPLLQGCKAIVLPRQSTCWYTGDWICLPATFLVGPCLSGKLRQ